MANPRPPLAPQQPMPPDMVGAGEPLGDARASRASDERWADLRDDFEEAGDNDSILHVPPHLIPPDTELRWVRESTLGDKDRGNMQGVMSRERFRPVTSAEFPSLAPPLLPGEKDQEEFIRNGGLILMQRPKVLGDRHRQRLAEVNRDVLQTVKRDLNGRMDGKNTYVDPTSNVEVTETTSEGRQRMSRQRFAE